MNQLGLLTKIIAAAAAISLVIWRANASQWKFNSASPFGDVIDVQYQGAADDTPHNAMFLPANAQLQLYSTSEQVFQFEFTYLPAGSTASVGVTNQYMFDQGYNIGAALYGRNLHTATALLVKAFGSRIKQGDVITMKVDQVDGATGTTKVYFAHNHHTLGLAFVLSTKDIPFLNPVVTFSGPGRVRAANKSGLHDFSSLDRRNIHRYGVTGRWKLGWCALPIASEASANAELFLRQQPPSNSPLAAVLHVVNNIKMKLTPTVQNRDVEGHSWVSSGGLNTMASFATATPELYEAENSLLAAFLASGSVLHHFTAADELHLTNSSSLVLKWQRANRIPAPFVGDPFSDWKMRNPTKYHQMLLKAAAYY